MRKVIYTLLVLAIVGSAGAAAYVYSGIYNVAATRAHSAPAYWLLMVSRRRSIDVRAEDIEVPELADAARVRSGLVRYMEHCVQCHGAPGIAPEPFALGMTPVAPAIMQLARDRDPAEIFWAAKHGIKMTGMPGWDYKLSDDEIWDIVAFIRTVRRLSPAMFYDMAGIAAPVPTSDGLAPAQPGVGRAERGRVALHQYGCISCHIVEGVTGPDAWVGPPLRNLAERKYLAGVLPNTPENLVRWIRNPQGYDPLTAMPNLGVDTEDARDIAAYLLSADDR